MKKEELVTIAEEINDVLGIDPAIDTELEEGALLEAIKAEAALIGVNPKTDKFDQKVFESDKKAFSEETFKFLEESGALGHVPAILVSTTEEKVAEEKKTEKKEEKPKADKKAVEKKEKPKAEKKVEKPNNLLKGPGVVAKIAEIIKASTKKAPVTKEGILEKLKEAFPDRAENSMKATINVQIPNRMAKEKGLNIIKGENGYFVE